jgi:hypothetical protein
MLTTTPGNYGNAGIFDNFIHQALRLSRAWVSLTTFIASGAL